MTTLDATDSAGLTLRIRFTRERDRYTHAILAVKPDGSEHLLLASVEGTAEHEWPPSPPLQSLSIEELAPGRRAALLVGMAGRSHWSASIEPVPGRAAIVFDIACRRQAMRPNALTLRSTYAERPCHAFRVAIVGQEGDPVDTLVDRHAEQVTIEPASEMNTAPTIRWRYSLELSEGLP